MPPFRYDSETNPYAQSIGELLARPGGIEAQRATAVANAQARAAEVSGNAWSGAAQNIGQTVAAIPQQMAQAKRTAVEDQAAQLKLDEAKRNQQFMGVTNGIVSGLMTANPDGTRTVDRTKAQAALAKANVPLPIQQSVFKQLDDLDASVRTFQKGKVDHAADVAHSVIGMIDAGMDPHTAVATGVAYAKANGLASDQELAPLVSAATSAQNPDDIKRMLTGVRGMSENYKDANKPITLAKDAELVTPSGQVLATGKEGGKTEAELAMDAANPTSPTQAQSASALAALKQAPAAAQTHNMRLKGVGDVPVDYIPGKDGTGGRWMYQGKDVTGQVAVIPSAAQVSINAGSLSDAALEQQARAYLKEGKSALPPGNGNAGIVQRTAIMNLAAKLDPTAALALNKAVYHADTANLTNLQKTEGTLSAFESTAGKNLDQFLTLAEKIPDTGVPWLNTPVRMLDAKLVGSANIAAINAARDVALREIARVTNDPKLSGALTDSARAEVMGLNPQNATLPQIKAVAKVLKQDMANVHKGINEQIDIVKSGIGGNPAKEAAPATGAPIKVGAFTVTVKP